MKKTILILIILLLVGLLFGCAEINNDPDGPSIQITKYDPTLTGTWEGEQGSNSQEFTFDGQGNFAMTLFFDGTSSGTSTGNYETNGNILSLINVTTTPSTTNQDLTATYTVSGNKLTLIPTNSSAATLILTKKETTPNLEAPNPPENNPIDVLASREPFGITDHYFIKVKHPENRTNTFYITIKNNTQETLKLTDISLNNLNTWATSFPSGLTLNSGVEIETQIENAPTYINENDYNYDITFKYNTADTNNKSQLITKKVSGEFEIIKYEEVACETDFFIPLKNDVNCEITYTGIEYNETKTARCTILADDDEYGNLCVPEPKIYIKVQSLEGYSPVPGLTGSFEGVACATIETNYNASRFFVGCNNTN